jgi:CTP:phosphocholine cytidylyltransferase-like protein/thiamine kinase-like enzyme
MNAIIMAAGTSSRFAPLSYEKPKGLLEVKGEILIERQIRQLHEAGITDITVIVGYKAELFKYLEEKFCVKLVLNKDYNHYNNTSSVIRVVDRLEDTYICSSDNYFSRNVFLDKPSSSYYSALYAQGQTNEYCIETDEDGNIIQVEVGGADSWYMVGHVFFSRYFSEAFKKVLVEEYADEKVRKEYWEDVYIRNIDRLPKMKIHRYEPGDLAEFDSLEELRQFDEKYINDTGCKVFTNICGVLDCEEKDIDEIVVLKKGMTNSSFRFTCTKNGQKYVYRHPGEGTEAFISRASEYFSMQVAKELELDNSFIYMHPTEGWKISSFIEDARILDYHNVEELTQALRMLAKLHEANVQSEFPYRLWDQASDFMEKIRKLGVDSTPDFEDLRKQVLNVYGHVEADNWPECLNHCDALAANFLIGPSEGSPSMTLIDWEYSGQGDTAQDLGSFIACSDMSYDEALRAIEIYLGHAPCNEELRHYLGYTAIASYCWYLWAIYQEAHGVDTGEFLDMWHRYAYQYSEAAINLYI